MILSIKCWRTKKKLCKSWITDWKILCVYIYVYHMMRNWGSGMYNSLHHADNRKYFLGLYLMWNWREAHMFCLVKEVGRISRCFCWEGSLIMINEFKYSETWKFWQSPLSLSPYSTFKMIKYAFYFTLKALFVSRYLNFCLHFLVM